MTKLKLNSYVVLLRGINVGGNNIIKMADLRKLLEDCGFQNVKTYIQSGNIILKSDEQESEEVSKNIIKNLKQKLDKQIKVLVIRQHEYEKIIADAPRSFGKENKKYKYDVIFLFSDLNSKAAAKEIDTHKEVDKIWAGERALYFRRDIKQLTKSKLRKIIGTKNYESMTTRNWRTSKKLLELLTEE